MVRHWLIALQALFDANSLVGWTLNWKRRVYKGKPNNKACPLWTRGGDTDIKEPKELIWTNGWNPLQEEVTWTIWTSGRPPLRGEIVKKALCELDWTTPFRTGLDYTFATMVGKINWWDPLQGEIENLCELELDWTILYPVQGEFQEMKCGI